MNNDDSSIGDESKQDSNTGHGPLLWGTLSTVLGYLCVFISLIFYTGALADTFGIVGALLTIGGTITWVTGFVQRIIFNRRSSNSLLFTTGEKFAVVGITLLFVGILLVNGNFDDSGVMVGRTIATAGIISTLGGAVWHLLSPRPSQDSVSN